jgi:hypothetical protein
MWQYLATLFQASSMAAIYNERVAITLGFATLVSAIAAFLSCRTCVSWLRRLGVKDPISFKGYATFYQYHVYYWWAFGILLVAHLMMAVIHTGLPQAGDPDAGVHWRILGMGFFSAVSGVVLFSSCRILPRLVTLATRKNPFHNFAYAAFFQKHSYFWSVMALLVAGHLIFSIIHTGVWPAG